MCVDTSYRLDIEGLLSDEWTTFIATFARFEFAMKRSGYLSNACLGAKAEANWDTFAVDLGSDLFEKCKADMSTRSLFDKPPELLKVKADNKVDWQTRGAIETTANLLLAVRDIRNNLLHGEKNRSADRDVALVKAAQIVLDHAWNIANADTANAKLQSFTTNFNYVY